MNSNYFYWHTFLRTHKITKISTLHALKKVSIWFLLCIIGSLNMTRSFVVHRTCFLTKHISSFLKENHRNLFKRKHKFSEWGISEFLKSLCIRNDDMSRYDAGCNQKGNQISERIWIFTVWWIISMKYDVLIWMHASILIDSNS